jgi:hypothetical protein
MNLSNRTIDVITDKLQMTLTRETTDVVAIGRLLAEAKVKSHVKQ